MSCCEMLKEKFPFSCILDEEIYWKYISKYKKDIINFLPVDYLGYKHNYSDCYIHSSSERNLSKIIKDGYISNQFSSDNCSLGKSIYTYPFNSGMHWFGQKTDVKFLIFETDCEHIHITQTVDSGNCFGVSVFFQDKVFVKNPKIVTKEQLDEISENNFDWKKAQQYFGVKSGENITYNNLISIFEKFN